MGKIPFLSRIIKICKAFVLTTLLFNVLLSPPVEAQNGVAGFKECNFNGQTNTQDVIGKCIQQVLQFALIVGVFVALFRIGYVALQSSNPFGGGGTTAQMVSALRDFGIGILILGGPVIILNTINPALLNFDFLSGVVNLTGSPNNNSSNNQGNDDSDTSISGSNASIDGTKPSDLQQAVETYKSNPADQNATNTIKKILEAQRECSSLFVTNYDQCKNIEDTGFQNALKQIPQDVQETLGSGFAPETDFQGNFVPTQDISIDPSGVSTFQSKDKNCKVFNIQISPTNNVNQSSTLSVEKCNQTISSSLFKKGPNGDLVINSNTTIKAGSVINEPKVTYLP